MEKTSTLLQIIKLALDINDEAIVKQAVTKLAEAHGLVPVQRYTSIEDISLYTPLHRGNRITAIKELRERAMENGMSCGLREAKEEVDRRVAIAEAPIQW
jgi:ribosomal protein L7/L12